MTYRSSTVSDTTLWPPAFDGAIFDFDGTIAETAYIWEHVDRAFLGARGIPYSEEYARALAVLGFDRGARYTIERYNLRETEADIVDEWKRLSWAFYRSEVTLKPGARSYILSLKRRGVRCALATSNEPELVRSMQHVDAAQLFDTCVYGCEVGVPKDQPDIYLEAARRMGVDPSRCVVFEDIEPGIRAAQSAGFLTCAVKADDNGQDWEAVSSASDLALTTWEGLVPLT